MHFEDLWNAAESVSDLLGATTDEAFDSIKKELKDFQTIDTIDALTLERKHEAKTIILGEIIYHLCTISRIHKLNSAAALANAIEDARSEIENPE